MDADAERDFAAFVASRSPALFRTAMALTGHWQQAEDLLQVALARSVRHWPKIRDGQPEAYVRTTMYRQYASWWRSRGRRQELVTGDVPEIPQADHSGAVDQTLAVAAALTGLAPKSRAVLVLRYLEDRPTDEIAEILRCSPATVRSQISRALARLRTLCPELDPIPEAQP
ncbi:MAG TPA: SigE family RNA polymerase sigma factor [Mycobacteriales bacterium]|nr:SigE family RNA polymerase sigma factor [Mycobacteriales bacterium]